MNVIASVPRLIWRESARYAPLESAGHRSIPEEAAIALSYNGGTYAVMMATPQNLHDFAVGFSLTEGIIDRSTEIETLEIVPLDDGIEVRMWLSPERAERLSLRRRHIAGPTGCGLCGTDSIADAVRPVARVRAATKFSPHQIAGALQTLPSLQPLNIETRAVHAAAFWTAERGMMAVREDVGRHNALDKLVGALAREGMDAQTGLVLLTSRVSIEMVQKTAALGAGIMVCVSAPTALAVRTAERAGITLVAVARSDGFEVFTHPHRINTQAAADVA